MPIDQEGSLSSIDVKFIFAQYLFVTRLFSGHESESGIRCETSIGSMKIYKKYLSKNQIESSIISLMPKNF